MTFDSDGETLLAIREPRNNWCQEWDLFRPDIASPSSQTCSEANTVSGKARMATRAASKQQELEEQLAKLVGLVEQQRQRQEQLAGEQRQRQEELAGEQRRRQEAMAQQQSEQLDRLMEEQQLQGKLILQQQREAEERMDAIKDDLAETKEIMEGRLQDAEANLEGMHRQLSEEWQEGQASLRKELQAEFRTELLALRSSQPEKVQQGQSEAEQTSTGTKPSLPLRPEATAFIPFSSSLPLSPGSDSGGVHRAGATQRPPLYDGRSSWDAYVTQFGMLAHLNNWNEEEKATLLAVSLRGAALTVLSNLPAERRGDYRALVTALENRFGTAHQAELHRMKLRNRTRRREETLAELMEDIERLARLAYPDAAPAMLELLAKDQFIDSLTDEDIKLKVRQSRPGTLQLALEAALELESYQLASRQRGKPVRVAQLDRESDLQSQRLERTKIAGASPEFLEELQQCMNLIQRFFSTETQSVKPQPQRGLPRRYPQRTRSQKQVTCWGCGGAGHIRRNCTKEPTGSTTPAAANPDHQDQGNGR